MNESHTAVNPDENISSIIQGMASFLAQVNQLFVVTWKSRQTHILTTNKCHKPL